MPTPPFPELFITFMTTDVSTYSNKKMKQTFFWISILICHFISQKAKCQIVDQSLPVVSDHLEIRNIYLPAIYNKDESSAATAIDSVKLQHITDYVKCMCISKNKSVIIEDHMDDRGSEESNLQFSMMRTERLKQALAADFTTKMLNTTFTFLALGEKQPIIQSPLIDNEKDKKKQEYYHALNDRVVVKCGE